MKKLLPIVLIACLYYGVSYGQLRIDTKRELNYSQQSIISFVTDNHFEYALMLWGTSNWSHIDRTFCCLFNQNGKWYVAELSRSIIEQPAMLDEGIKIKQKAISLTQADSIKAILKPDSTFRYVQTDLDNLPIRKPFMKHGQLIGSIEISDGGTDFLLQYSKQKVDILSYYCPEIYFENYYPYVKEFEILKPFINTRDQLYSVIRSLK